MNRISHKVIPIPNFQGKMEPNPCLSSLKPQNYPSSRWFLNRFLAVLLLLLVTSDTVAKEKNNEKCNLIFFFKILSNLSLIQKTLNILNDQCPPKLGIKQASSPYGERWRWGTKSKVHSNVQAGANGDEAGDRTVTNWGWCWWPWAELEWGPGTWARACGRVSGEDGQGH